MSRKPLTPSAVLGERDLQWQAVMRKPAFSRRRVAMAAALATGAVICQLAFHRIGARVDRQGVLYEAFALQPISVLLLVSSGLVLIGALGRPKPLS